MQVTVLEHPQHVPQWPAISDRYKAGDWWIVPILLVETPRHKRDLLTKELNSQIMKKGLIVGLQVWAANHLNQNNLGSLFRMQTPKFTLDPGNRIIEGWGSWTLNPFPRPSLPTQGREPVARFLDTTLPLSVHYMTLCYTTLYRWTPC